MKPFTPAQRQHISRLLQAEQDKYAQGVRDGRDQMRREMATQSEVRREEMRARTIDAMAHALKALADVAVPQRV